MLMRNFLLPVLIPCLLDMRIDRARSLFDAMDICTVKVPISSPLCLNSHFETCFKAFVGLRVK
jgi:hypothetical protein